MDETKPPAAIGDVDLTKAHVVSTKICELGSTCVDDRAIGTSSFISESSVEKESVGSDWSHEEYLLVTGGLDRANNCTNGGTEEESSPEKPCEDIDLSSPIFEDELEFDEFPTVENGAGKNDFSYSKDGTDEEQMSANFPSTEESYYLSPEDADYCDALFGVKNTEDQVNTKLLKISSSASAHASSTLDPIETLQEICGANLIQSLANRSSDGSFIDPQTLGYGTFGSVSTHSVPAAGGSIALGSSLSPSVTTDYSIVSPSNSWKQECASPALSPMVNYPPSARFPKIEYTFQTGASDPRAKIIEMYPSYKSLHGASRADLAWNQRFEELKQFKSIHGHTNVPQKYENNPSLGAWVARNRLFMRQLEEEGGEQMKKKSKVAKAVHDERMRLLKEIGLESSIGKYCLHSSTYMSHMSDAFLLTYKITLYQILKIFLGKGAFGRTTGHLMSSRIARDWEHQFRMLQEYRDKYGNCEFATTFMVSLLHSSSVHLHMHI